MSRSTLLFLALVWGAVLLPRALRDVRDSPLSTVTGFTNAMARLAVADQRLLFVPTGSGRTAVVHPRHVDADRSLRRRRLLLVQLLAGSVGSLTLALVVGGALTWTVSAIVTTALVVYCVLLRAAVRRRAPAAARAGASGGRADPSTASAPASSTASRADAAPVAAAGRGPVAAPAAAPVAAPLRAAPVHPPVAAPVAAIAAAPLGPTTTVEAPPSRGRPAAAAGRAVRPRPARTPTGRRSEPAEADVTPANATPRLRPLPLPVATGAASAVATDDTGRFDDWPVFDDSPLFPDSARTPVLVAESG